LDEKGGYFLVLPDHPGKKEKRRAGATRKIVKKKRRRIRWVYTKGDGMELSLPEGSYTLLGTGRLSMLQRLPLLGGGGERESWQKKPTKQRETG